jgi:hypothetical protein
MYNDLVGDFDENGLDGEQFGFLSPATTDVAGRLKPVRKLLGLKPPGEVSDLIYREKVVTDTFNLFLGRDPSETLPPGGGPSELERFAKMLAFNTTKKKPGKTVEFITADLMSSLEYYLIPHEIP